MPFIVYYLLKARIIELFHEDFPEEKRYRVTLFLRIARRCIRILMRHGRIETEYTGQEYLPKEGGICHVSQSSGKI